MMKIGRSLGCGVALLLALTSVDPAQARRPRWNGLGAIAVSPDGRTIAVGGANRTLYVVDAESLTVTGRHWHGAQIGALAFNADGTRLVLEDETSSVLLLETEGYTAVRTIGNTDFIAPAPQVDRMAVLLTGRQPRLALLSMTDGSTVREFALPEGFRVLAHTLSPDGARIAVLSQEFDRPEELATEEPDGLPQGHARLLQRNKASRFLVIDAATGELLRDHTFWYSSQGAYSTTLAFHGEDVIVFNYSGVNARIDAEGNVAVLEGLQGFAYGRGLSTDHSRIVTGGLAAGSLGRLTPDGLSVVPFNVTNRLRGWPEYFADFAFAPGDLVYGVTSSFRIIRINEGGHVTAEAPVY